MRALGTGLPALAGGLQRIREELGVPAAFPAHVLAHAERSVQRGPRGTRVDLTDIAFVTLDPADATDLDQAFALHAEGDLVVLDYAIADVGAFVEHGDPVDREAWERGTTTYLPDGKAGLYPPGIAEGAASLLPDGPRPAIRLQVAVDPDGGVVLRRAERAAVLSRAKLGYESTTPDRLPALLGEVAARVERAEEARGAERLEFPEQEVEPDHRRAGCLRLRLRPRTASEDDNATLSLASNLAVAATLQAARTGLYRVMDDPDEREIASLRRAARALGVPWGRRDGLRQALRHLDGDDARHAAFLLAVRRASGGARYEPFRDGTRPWHAAVAACYAHATAPLRRLADRYVLDAAVAVAAGEAVPPQVRTAFEELPAVMARADQRSSQVDRAVVDLAEAVALHGREGERFRASVLDATHGRARILLDEMPVIATVDAGDSDGAAVAPGGGTIEPGDAVVVRLQEADPSARRVAFVLDQAGSSR
jgi:exoribonuclease R